MSAKGSWTSFVFVAIASACISAGKTQESVHVRTPIWSKVMQGEPDGKPETFKPAVLPTVSPPLGGRPLGTPVVLRYEPGGHIGTHRARFFNYKRDGDRVELRGPCYSACTLVTGYVPRDMICVGEGAFLAFHAAQDGGHPPQRHISGTLRMFETYPQHIRDWLDEQGGVDKLPGPGQGFWVMYDRDLWRMGYPKCP